jgi:hypothetical protein
MFGRRPSGTDFRIARQSRISTLVDMHCRVAADFAGPFSESRRLAPSSPRVALSDGRVGCGIAGRTLGTLRRWHGTRRMRFSKPARRGLISGGRKCT